MVNGCLKNNSLISLEYDLYNFLYSIEVKERYSYKKVSCRIALGPLHDSHANVFSWSQKGATDIFNQEYKKKKRRHSWLHMVDCQSTGESIRGEN